MNPCISSMWSDIQRMVRHMILRRLRGGFRLMPRQRWVWKQRFAIGWFLFALKLRRTLRLIRVRCRAEADTSALQSRDRH